MREKAHAGCSVVISADFDRGNRTSHRLVLTLGRHSWCTSNWQPIYYRLWRVNASGSTLLLDKSEIAFAPSVELEGAVTPTEMLVEFRKGSTDPARHNYGAVRHFTLNGDGVKRADPIALSPKSFVDEWLESPWSEAAAWSDRSQTSLEQWHRPFSGEFGETLHCRNAPDLWQVSINPYQPAPSTYFLVRWRPPYRFTMVGVSATHRADCTEKDPQADDDRTLFPRSER